MSNNRKNIRVTAFSILFILVTHIIFNTEIVNGWPRFQYSLFSSHIIIFNTEIVNVITLVSVRLVCTQRHKTKKYWWAHLSDFDDRILDRMPQKSVPN